MTQYIAVNRRGSVLFVRGIHEGKSFLYKEKYKPHLFVRCPSDKEMHRDFFGGHVRKKSFDTIYEMTQYIKTYGDIEGELWGTKNPEYQYILENFGKIENYSVEDVRVVFMDIEVMTRLKTETGDWIDTGFPEASEALYPVNAICLYDSKEKKFFQFTTAEWKKEDSLFPNIAEETVYVSCETEKELLKKFLLHWKAHFPDILSGWNTDTFDVPYLVNRIVRLFGEEVMKELSPWKIVEEKEVRSSYGTDTTYEIYGIASLDYLRLYKKYRMKMRKSYKLDYIAFKELGERKAKVEGSLGEFYWKNPQGFIDYNLNDVYLVKHLDERFRFIYLVMSIAYAAGVNFSDTFSPVKTWDNLIYRRCSEKGISVPVSENFLGRTPYDGAFVFPVKSGMQRSVVSFDLTSLYPSIMRGLNISPETILRGEEREAVLRDLEQSLEKFPDFKDLLVSETPFMDYYVKNGSLPEPVETYLKEHGLSMTPNYQFYDVTRKSIFTELIDELFFGRKADKKKSQELAQEAKKLRESGDEETARRLDSESFIFDLYQQTKKILLNSLYGALGNDFFRFYMSEMAASITLTGQMIIRTAAKEINAFLARIDKKDEVQEDAYIIAGDTDSCDGRTLLRVMMSGKEELVPFSTFFETLPGEPFRSRTGNLVKKVENVLVSSLEGGRIIRTPVVYAMKHRVKKRIFRLEAAETMIRVTADHSLICQRGESILSVKPEDLRPGDAVIIFGKEVRKETSWTLVDEGILEEDVYDIETENHMFFGNDILVHNSVYIDFSPVLKRLSSGGDLDLSDRDHLTDMIDKVAKKVETDAIQPAFERMQGSLNFFQKTLHMDREVICIPSEKTGYCGFWCAKKHYCLLVSDMEGFRFPPENPKQKSMGLFYMQSSCPEILQPDLEKSARIMITEGEEETRRFLKEVHERYTHMSVEEIAFPKTVSYIQKYIDPEGSPVKGTPVHSKAALYYNKLVSELGLQKKYEEIKEMDKMLFVYLRENPKGLSVIGFKEELPKEFGLHAFVDYDIHFEKSFRKPLEDMMTSVGWSLEKKASLFDLF